MVTCSALPSHDQLAIESGECRTSAAVRVGDMIRSSNYARPLDDSVKDPLVACSALPGHVQLAIEYGECRTSTAVRTANSLWPCPSAPIEARYVDSFVAFNTLKS